VTLLQIIKKNRTKNLTIFHMHYNLTVSSGVCLELILMKRIEDNEFLEIKIVNKRGSIVDPCGNPKYEGSK
jgi:hypothetical protein